MTSLIDTPRPADLDDDPAWDLFIKGRCAEWEKVQAEQDWLWHIPLLDYVGMSAPEFMIWIRTGRVAGRVRRVWSRPTHP